jgi:hypothetical protein
MAELILGNALMLTDVARNTSVSALACWQQLTLQAAEGRSTLADFLLPIWCTFQKPVYGYLHGIVKDCLVHTTQIAFS